MDAAEYLREETDFEIEQLDGHQDPDWTIAQCARNDKMGRSIIGLTQAEILDGVKYGEEHVEVASEFAEGTRDLELLAKEYAMLERLMRRGHWGVFEQASATIAFKAVSRISMAQLTRHRVASWDVQSLRVIDARDVPMLTPKSAIDPDHATAWGVCDMDDDDREAAQELIAEGNQDTQERYQRLLELGMPKEDARSQLPMATTVNMCTTMNLRAILHVLNMRDTNEAQWEAQGIAECLEDELRDWAPLTFYAWDKHGPFQEGP